MVAVTGSSEDIARQTLALYFEPDRGVDAEAGRDQHRRAWRR